MKLKPGVKVKIKFDIYPGYNCCVGCTPEMVKFAGKVVTISEIIDKNCLYVDKFGKKKYVTTFRIEEDCGNWRWDTELIEYLSRNSSLFGVEFYKLGEDE